MGTLSGRTGFPKSGVYLAYHLGTATGAQEVPQAPEDGVPPPLCCGILLDPDRGLRPVGAREQVGAFLPEGFPPRLGGGAPAPARNWQRRWPPQQRYQVRTRT